MNKFFVDPDIKKADTLPSSFYKNDEQFEEVKEKVFANSWQFVGHNSILPVNVNTYPFEFMQGFIQEPLLLVKNQDESLTCLSNVCTHRANIVIHNTGQVKDLKCQYHGRKFDLDGKFKSMPEFQTAKDFPRECDSLKRFPLEKLGPFIFVGLEPNFDINNVFDKIYERVSFLNLDHLNYRPDLSKDYMVNSHWALYCDNYLEGFHIPFVHDDLNNVLDYGAYETEIDDYFNVQIGYAKDGDNVFDFPKGHQDYGKNIGGYYYWIYPNCMLNFYPWGLSMNIVKPINRNKTKVSYLTYVLDESKLGSGAGSGLDKVEREDEFVVEGVHKGLSSRYYSTGRFSPTMEKGVHHFHLLLSKAMNK
tara:strand:- start:4807 stop:5892 length:1086 start_codon:yes stop_codon:yes gene_type:complete